MIMRRILKTITEARKYESTESSYDSFGEILKKDSFPRFHTSALPRLFFVLIFFNASSCSLKFDLTSQRTALENQVLGSYNELDDDLVMVASVRSLDSSGKKKDADISDLQTKALRARQNQDFNRDDIDELKAIGILGETSDGLLALLPEQVGGGKNVDVEQTKLAHVLIGEENRDRDIIWQRIIQSNENLSEKDLPEVKKTYAKMMREKATVGHWYQSDKGQWEQKTASAQ